MKSNIILSRRRRMVVFYVLAHLVWEKFKSLKLKKKLWVVEASVFISCAMIEASKIL